MRAEMRALHVICKALDKTKLVLVQRVRHDKSGDHVTKKWVSADKVKKTDKVLQTVPFSVKLPDAKGKPGGPVNPMAKLAATQKKKASAKKQTPAASKSTEKPEAAKPAAAKKKTSEAAPGPAAKKSAAGKKPDTYAKTEPAPKVKPPIVRTDVNALGRKNMSESKISTILESVREGDTGSPLTVKVAENAREKAYVSVLNTITDPGTLHRIAYTGIIPEDESAARFMETKLYERYAQMKNAPKRLSESELESASRSIREVLKRYFPGTTVHAVDNALNDTSLAGADFVFRLVYPAESTMLLGSMSRGNRQVPANSDTMRYWEEDKTSPANLFGTGKWYAAGGGSPADGMHRLLGHIADHEPSLATEAAAWADEFTQVMDACGNDSGLMNLALNNTYDRVSDVCTPDAYNTIVGGILRLYGASLTDRGNTAFDGDYNQLSAADCMRLTYSETGTPERRAVMTHSGMLWSQPPRSCRVRRNRLPTRNTHRVN